MRPPSPLRRALTPVLAAWFLLAVGEQPLVHRCAVHDGPVPAAPGGHAGHHGASDAPAPEDGGGSCCTCVGACAGGCAAVAPQAALATLPASDPAIVVGVRERPTPPHATPRLLPFANGPPPSSV
jgi:hypothetical protein